MDYPRLKFISTIFHIKYEDLITATQSKDLYTAISELSGIPRHNIKYIMHGLNFRTKDGVIPYYKRSQTMDYKVEKVWTHKGNTCVVIMTSQGHRCGYVGIKPNHPLYGVKYTDTTNILQNRLEQLKLSKIGKRGIIPVLFWDKQEVTPEIYFDVHGGITYSGGDNNYPIESTDLWWFGYDCAHSGDARDQNVLAENSKYIPLFNDGVVRSLEYCIQECENFSDQLNDLLGNEQD